MNILQDYELKRQMQRHIQGFVPMVYGLYLQSNDLHIDLLNQKDWGLLWAHLALLDLRWIYSYWLAPYTSGTETGLRAAYSARCLCRRGAGNNPEMTESL